MTEKQKLILVSLFLLIGEAGILSCGKRCIKEYEFVLLFTVNPTKDTLDVGDTLWVKADFPDNIKDFKSGDSFKVKDFNFRTNIIMYRLIGDSIVLTQQPGAIAEFDVVENIGFFKKPHSSSAANVVYNYQNNRYQLEFGLIPQGKGVFSFLFYYDVHPGRINKVDITDSKCEERMNFMRFFINESQNNIHIREQHALTSTTEGDEQLIHQFIHGSYSFIVR